MNCTNPVDIILQAEKNVKTRRKLKVGCGQCINCKTKRAREWTNRLLDEAQAHKDVSIIVLTYNRHHIKKGERTSKGNEFYTLWPADVQKYIKRLKINMDRAYKEDKIDVQGKDLRYYVAGEYGEKRKRPHYHVVLFGLNGLKHKEHRILAWKSWGLGKVYHDNKNRELSQSAFAYVAQYVQKKIYEGNHLSHYTKKKIIPPYNTSSKGIGRETALKNRKKFEENDYKYADNKDHVQRIPRYYIKLYKQQDIQRIMEVRAKLEKGEITSYEARVEQTKIWLTSTEYYLLKLNKKLKDEQKKMMAKDGIITTYNNMDIKQLKQTEIWQKIAEEYKNEKNTKKPIDMWIKASIIRYEREYGETYEMQQTNLYNAKKLEKFRHQKMKEHKRNKDGQ